MFVYLNRINFSRTSSELKNTDYQAIFRSIQRAQHRLNNFQVNFDHIFKSAICNQAPTKESQQSLVFNCVVQCNNSFVGVKDYLLFVYNQSRDKSIVSGLSATVNQQVSRKSSTAHHLLETSSRVIVSHWAEQVRYSGQSSTSTTYGDRLKDLAPNWLETTSKYLERLHNYQDVESLLNPLKSKLEGKNLTLLLNKLSRKSRNRSTSFLKVFQWAKEVGIQLDGVHYMTMIGALGNRRELSLAMEIFDEARAKGVRPKVVVYNAALDALLKSEEVSQAEALLERMRSEGDPRGNHSVPRPDTRTFNTLISSLARRGNWQKAGKMMWVMQRDGCRPNVFTFNALISACAHGRRLDYAFQWYEIMKSSGVKTDTVTYNTLISACEKARRVEEAFEVFQEMRVQGLKPDTITFNSLISACEKTDHWERAVQVMQRMKDDGCQPDHITYSSLISACGKGRQVESAFRWFKEMRESGTRPTAITFNALITACAQVGDYHRAQQVLGLMQEEGCRPDVISLSSVMTACERAGRLSEAFHWFRQMKLLHITPDIIAYNTLISACEKAGDWETAAKVIQIMKADGCEPDIVTYSSLIAACKKASKLDQAFYWLGKMKNNGIMPNTISYNAVISTCLKANDSKRAVQVYTMMCEDGVQADAATYQELLQIYEKSNQWEKAYILFRDIEKDQRVYVDYGHVNSLLNVLWNNGKFSIGMHKLRQALDSNLYPIKAREPLGYVISGEALAIDLHEFSYGSSLARTIMWLYQLYEAFHVGDPTLPNRLVIITGWGKHSKTGASEVKDTVTAFLQETNSPFRILADNDGRFDCETKLAVIWLQSLVSGTVSRPYKLREKLCTSSQRVLPTLKTTSHLMNE